MLAEQNAASASSKLILALKSILGGPIPLLLVFFSLSLFLHEQSAFVLSVIISTLTLLYILVDRMQNNSEFSFFRLGFDFPIILIVICSLMAYYSAFNLDLSTISKSLRWAVFLYLFTYTLNLFPSLNRMFYSLMIVGIGLSIYGIIQSTTGTDFLYGTPGLANFAQAGEQIWLASGFYLNVQLYALIISASACISYSAFICQRYKFEGAGIFYLFLTICSLCALYFTYDARFWFACLAALAVISYIKKLRWFILYFFALSLVLGSLFQFNSEFRTNTVRALQYQSQLQLIENGNWETHLESFKANKWIGTGLALDDTKALELQANKANFQNSFLQILLQTGILGFAAYCLLMILSVFMCLRLLSEIPRTHYWHQVFVMSCIGFLCCFHISGLGYFNFNYASSRLLLLFFIACISHMSHAYGKGIVPDDRIL